LELSLPRGIRDIEPEEFELHEEILSAFRDTAKLFCFSIMEPATIETSSVLTAKSGPDILKELYSFADKAGREIGLRFDLTVGMTRYVCSRKELRLPLKLASYGSVWRYDEPQHARFRSFKQWDVEIFDKNTIDSDAEAIEFTYRLLSKLGIKFTIEIGHRMIAQEFIRKLGIEERNVEEALRMLDKAQKKSVEQLVKEYEEKGFSREKIEGILSISKMKGKQDSVLKELGLSGIHTDEISLLCDMLRDRGVNNFSLNMGIVRGLDYYTGVVFEAFDTLRKDLGAVCGGGRYDILPKIFGRKDISATGVAGGIERIAISLISEKKEKREAVFVAYTGRETYNAALKIVRALRDSSLPSEVPPIGLTLKKQMELASSERIKWVLIVGPRDLAEEKVTLRDMVTGKEESVPLKELVEKLEHLLSKN
jgi:histidyl-tRNA synthetase